MAKLDEQLGDPSPVGIPEQIYTAEKEVEELRAICYPFGAGDVELLSLAEQLASAGVETGYRIIDDPPYAELMRAKLEEARDKVTTLWGRAGSLGLRPTTREASAATEAAGSSPIDSTNDSLGNTIEEAGIVPDEIVAAEKRVRELRAICYPLGSDQKAFLELAKRAADAGLETGYRIIDDQSYAKQKRAELEEARDEVTRLWGKMGNPRQV